jgi:hypothetical protein
MFSPEIRLEEILKLLIDTGINDTKADAAYISCMKSWMIYRGVFSSLL